MALVDLAFLNKGGRDRFGKFALWSMGARYIDRGWKTGFAGLTLSK